MSYEDNWHRHLYLFGRETSYRCTMCVTKALRCYLCRGDFEAGQKTRPIIAVSIVQLRFGLK